MQTKARVKIINTSICCDYIPRRKSHQTKRVIFSSHKTCNCKLRTTEARIECEESMVIWGFYFSHQLSRLQAEKIKVIQTACSKGGHPDQAHCAIWADLPSQCFIHKLHRLLTKNAHEFVDTQVNYPKLCHQAADKVQYYNITTVAQDTLHMEILDG